MSLLVVKDLTMRFGGLVAVNSVDLHLVDGEILSVIGPNGAGKTTVFNAITGIYAPTSGEISFCGKPIEQRPTPLKVISWGLVGLGVAFLSLLVCNMQSLWEAVIAANYIYLEPFPWRKAFADFFSFFGSQSAWFHISATKDSRR